MPQLTSMLQVYFDTGSADFIVADSACSQTQCGDMTRYNASASTTAVRCLGIPVLVPELIPFCAGEHQGSQHDELCRWFKRARVSERIAFSRSSC